MTVNLGVSKLPGRTFGKMQVMTDVQAAYNLLAAVRELREKYGEVVTFNEGDRSRADQDVVWFAYLNGGPLAATRYTSTHDPVNNGNAADIGGPGGAVISDNARELLDGNHPRGVVGRKYGVFNTGWNFWKREIWHFNVYTSRADVLAGPPSIPVKPKPKPSPEEDEAMKFTVEYKDPAKKTGRTVTFWMGARSSLLSTLTRYGQTYSVDQQIAILRKLEKATAQSAVTLTMNERQIAQTLTRRLK